MQLFRGGGFMIRDLIAKNKLVTVEPDARVTEVARKMTDEDIGAVMVVDEEDGKPRGILTDRDIVVRCIAKNIDVNDCTVEQILTESVELVKESDGVFDCIHKMKNARVRRMPVVDDQGKAVGIISFGDLIGMLSMEFSELAEAATPAAPGSSKRQPMNEKPSSQTDQLKAA
jgi:signal-transduction protein with cAMP-binding, CBS, and nucleotidyltransferase domain